MINLPTTMTKPEITKAASVLTSGGLVAFPTETVYGLGADASNALAIRKIFEAKERPYDHPLIVHVASVAQLDEWAKDISPDALRLARIFWPGPLTMIFRKQAHVLDIVTGGQETIGLRIPRHPVAKALLEAFGGGIAAPSANRFTHISPTTAAAVNEELGGRVDMILDGGDCEVGLESTIIDMSGEQPVILRPGMISRGEIEALLERHVLFSRQDSPVRAPGMHHLHYAPTTKTMLIDSGQLPGFMQALQSQDLPVAIVAFNESLSAKENIHIERMPLDATAYAHNLYHVLRTLDHQHFKRIVIEAVPDSPEWEAISDRLTKASSK
jgi:L-threonylcarbamoyladenylate synthase